MTRLSRSDQLGMQMTRCATSMDVHGACWLVVGARGTTRAGKNMAVRLQEGQVLGSNALSTTRTVRERVASAVNAYL